MLFGAILPVFHQNEYIFFKIGSRKKLNFSRTNIDIEFLKTNYYLLWFQISLAPTISAANKMPNKSIKQMAHSLSRHFSPRMEQFADKRCSHYVACYLTNKRSNLPNFCFTSHWVQERHTQRIVYVSNCDLLWANFYITFYGLDITIVTISLHLLIHKVSSASITFKWIKIYCKSNLGRSGCATG